MANSNPSVDLCLPYPCVVSVSGVVPLVIPGRRSVAMPAFTAADLARAPLPPVLCPEILNMRYACELGTHVKDTDLVGATQNLQQAAVEVRLVAATLPPPMFPTHDIMKWDGMIFVDTRLVNLNLSR